MSVVPVVQLYVPARDARACETRLHGPTVSGRRATSDMLKATDSLGLVVVLNDYD